jgi:hypothetical protein
LKGRHTCRVNVSAREIRRAVFPIENARRKAFRGEFYIISVATQVENESSTVPLNTQSNFHTIFD